MAVFHPRPRDPVGPDRPGRGHPLPRRAQRQVVRQRAVADLPQPVLDDVLKPVVGQPSGLRGLHRLHEVRAPPQRPLEVTTLSEPPQPLVRCHRGSFLLTDRGLDTRDRNEKEPSY